jgi:NAD(P)H-flavin reductase
VKFVIKIYKPDKQFPSGGLFTQYLDNKMLVGDSLMCGPGPEDGINYLGWGAFTYQGNNICGQKQKIGLIAGGSGISTLYAIALASTLIRDKMDITLLFSNKTKEDLFLENELNDLLKMNKYLKIFYTLTRHDSNKHGHWQGLQGRISYEMFKECEFPDVADDVFILSCGPGGFNGVIHNFLI